MVVPTARSCSPYVVPLPRRITYQNFTKIHVLSTEIGLVVNAVEVVVINWSLNITVAGLIDTHVIIEHHTADVVNRRHWQR